MRLPSNDHRGQTLVEFALVAPVFFMVLIGIVVLGIGVFYQQQLTNAAREAARYAAIHTASSDCPTASTLPPINPPAEWKGPCDSPAEGWPAMTEHARKLIFGLPKDAVRIAACWSGYVNDANGAYDAPATGTYDIGGGSTVTISSTWEQCSIGGVDPTASPSAIPCDAGLVASTMDTASNLSEGPGRNVANRVTAIACYVWRPPMAGFLLIPEAVTLRGIVTEALERQQ